MVALLSARILELALHFAVLGGLADVALQLHHGHVREAILHAAIASICIVVLAGASYLAKKLISKSPSNVQLAVTFALTRKKPQAKAQNNTKGSARPRKSL
jgi:hypothetical protein